MVAVSQSFVCSKRSAAPGKCTFNFKDFQLTESRRYTSVRTKVKIN